MLDNQRRLFRFSLIGDCGLLGGEFLRVGKVVVADEVEVVVELEHIRSSRGDVEFDNVGV